ncbi:MAG: 30S ribosomal protein S20 [Chthoniobacterales bacterium]|nr:30S ribosomal protein S20 [Chthoniobacterales bacterium]
MASSKTTSKVLKKSDSGTKRAKQGIVRSQRNVSLSSRLKTQEKKVLAAIGEEIEQAKSAFGTLVSMLEKAVNKGVIHKNKATRKKSLFHQRLQAAQPAGAKIATRPKAPKGQTAKDKSMAKAKLKSKVKK